ncbi:MULTISPECIES: flavin reductase family protein [unclassified Cupriavidus]|uniref:flavin reductase family protein n=1 Tax=unclassified Cupriavidus TaxID=2640874 RepID=UPI001C00539C|nr:MULTISPECIES: flavin reductase family protein [unclassified Cupriavidus]MCA3182900.1 flavin reductase family protein [Cupriavidus sp.]MCA3190175.1 flavin reductase family protein [Cupriavidus sp.]MCA3199674.1 flavin reductase family protein [Cupriavidus sp.]MCA3205599.1 flavin reductase family protein [Cupriavidus sp.]MCA3207110.1 flavin reductase family protein [Cupriavidus sp.]
MEIDFSAITEYQRYKLMASLIVPRPIALVTTLGADGTANAAPFSMFNMLGEEPPIVMISVNRLGDGSLKDTAANIVRTQEFVVHLSDEAMAEKMHRCGERLPPDMSELAHVGLTAAPCTDVAPPRIAEAPVAFECRLWETLETESRQIFIGRVLRLHARDGLIDTDRWRVRLQEYFPVGRFGASFYVTTRDRFSLEKDAGVVTASTAIDEM